MFALLRVFFCMLPFFLLLACSTEEPVMVPDNITAAVDEEDEYEDKLKLQEEIIKRQQMQIKRQEREFEDLKRQKFYNESYRRYENRVDE